MVIDKEKSDKIADKVADARAKKDPPPAVVEPDPPRDYLAVLRDIARAQAMLSPQRQDPCGPLWSELAESCDHELTK